MVQAERLAEAATGDLHTRIPANDILVLGPAWIEKDKLRWKWESSTVKGKKPGGGILQEFIRLWKTNDAAIEGFANRWGALRYDVHGQPVKSVDGGNETLAYWRFLSRRAYSVLVLARELSEGRNGSEKYLKLISTFDTQGGHVKPRNPDFYHFPDWSRRKLDISREGFEWGERHTLDEMRDVLAGESSYWLRIFQPHLGVGWNKHKGWHLEMNYSGRFLPVIAMQLAQQVCAGEMFECAGCQDLYFRRSSIRRPNAGQSNYCTNCGKVAALKKADERRRESKREVHRLSSKGLTVGEIAQRLGKRRETVEGWIKMRKGTR
jgi:transposase-like protein